MIFSDKKIVVQHVKGGSFRFVTVQDFNIVRIDVVGGLIIPPHHYVLPKDFNVGAFTKHVNKRFVWKKAAFAFW